MIEHIIYLYKLLRDTWFLSRRVNTCVGVMEIYQQSACKLIWNLVIFRVVEFCKYQEFNTILSSVGV